MRTWKRHEHKTDVSKLSRKPVLKRGITYNFDLLGKAEIEVIAAAVDDTFRHAESVHLHLDTVPADATDGETTKRGEGIHRACLFVDDAVMRRVWQVNSCMSVMLRVSTPSSSMTDILARISKPCSPCGFEFSTIVPR